MTLKDTLYRIESRDGGDFGLLMLDGHPVYEGHFPGEPVTPGVLTLATVRECASELAGSALQYSEIKSCRFAAMIRPGDRLTLHIEAADTDSGRQIKAEIKDTDGGLRLTLDATLTNISD